MANEISLKEIFNTATSLLEENHVEHIHKNIFTKYIYGYPIPKKLSYDKEKIQEKLKLIYWAVASIHLELGNMLIAIRSYNKFKAEKDKNNTYLSYMLFIHHYFLAIECIYRSWERVSRVLILIHTKEAKHNCYYHKVITILKESNVYPKELIDELESHLLEWKKIKSARNKFSHEYSKLTYGMDSEVLQTAIVNSQGYPYFKIEETEFMLESMFNSTRDQYYYLKEIDQSLVKFINSFS